MNVEIGAEAAIFPEKEYISGIFVAVYSGNRVGLAYLATYIFNELEYLIHILELKKENLSFWYIAENKYSLDTIIILDSLQI